MDNKHTSQSESAWQGKQPNRKPITWSSAEGHAGGVGVGADTGASAAVNGWIPAFIPAKLTTVENTVFHNRPL